MSIQPVKKLWQPCAHRIEQSNIAGFIKQLSSDYPKVTNYDTLYDFSITQFEQFWQAFWEYTEIICTKKSKQVFTAADSPINHQWFVGARLNYAENILRFRDDREAVIFRSENGSERRLTYAQLYQEVVRCRALLESLNVKPGDRVAGYMSNNIEAIVAMLATASMGAIWASCSPDFGVKGVYERFSQIEPKVLFAIDGYHYNGKSHDVLPSVSQIKLQISSIKHVVVVPFLQTTPDISSIQDGLNYNQFSTDKTEIEFAQLPFDYPLYVLFSSGTTGKPKCILHGAGGSLLQHLKEHRLHCDIKREDKLFYFTTCGWMMWNWLASGLASGCTLILYDGSPFYPRRRSLWQLAQDLEITVFGTSARYISACAKAKLKPAEEYDLSKLRAILSTGSPLVADSFDYVYENIKQDVMLSSISGGTDIVSCFVLGNPVRPVYRGQIQGAGLGMGVAVFDEKGHAIREKRGELVCTTPFPCRPLHFWGDETGQRYLESYYSRYKGIWSQGDFAQITAEDGVIIYGRSDTVLNPGGVRIGTAEIYQQIEKIDEVFESVCIGQQWEDDVRVVLFVVLQDGVELDTALKQKIRMVIQDNTTRRHVPKKIIAVTDIPRTKSGKIVELAVRNIVHGDSVQNTASLANPEALDLFKNIAELQA